MLLAIPSTVRFVGEAECVAEVNAPKLLTAVSHHIGLFDVLLRSIATESNNHPILVRLAEEARPHIQRSVKDSGLYRLCGQWFAGERPVIRGGAEIKHVKIVGDGNQMSAFPVGIKIRDLDWKTLPLKILRRGVIDLPSLPNHP